MVLQDAPRETPIVQTRRALLSVVMIAALVLVFIEAAWLTLVGAAALVVYLVLGWRQFGFGAWVPVLLALGVLTVALLGGVPGAVLMDGFGRMLFLAALVGLLVTLRSAATLAREVTQAGAYLTGQPASRRYLALTFGGHVFGVLINFGGLALLLDMAMRSMDTDDARRMPPEIREVKLKRMTLAVLRGFSLISLWSPLGFATNAILIAIPGLTYVDFGPFGFAMSFLFVGIGWAVDRIEGRHVRRKALPRPAPPKGSGLGAVLLVGHVVLVGGSVFLLHGLSPLDFQQALILVVPAYALLWSAVVGIGRPGGSTGAVTAAVRGAWVRLSDMTAEIGVFAAAGFASVVLPALIPVDALRGLIADVALGPATLAPGLSAAIIALAFVGVNPIVTSSVLGAIASQLDVPGLGAPLIALAITGGWAVVIGLSPCITTVIFCSAIIRRPAARIGPVWNGPYCLAIFLAWWVVLWALMAAGVL